MSSPIFEKGGDSTTQKLGKSAGGGNKYPFASNLLHKTQQCITFLTSCHPRTIQNLLLSSFKCL